MLISDWSSDVCSSDLSRKRRATSYAEAVSSYVDKLDERRGAVFSSNYEYPGRYTRWDTAIVDPPLGISSHGRKVWIEAYNGRGEVLLSFIADKLATVRSEEHTSDLPSLMRISYAVFCL